MGKVLHMNPVLKPCPFCGSEELEISEVNESVYVQCEGCFCNGPTAFIGCRDDEDIDLEAEAIRDWNERGTRYGG